MPFICVWAHIHICEAADIWNLHNIWILLKSLKYFFNWLFFFISGTQPRYKYSSLGGGTRGVLLLYTKLWRLKVCTKVWGQCSGIVGGYGRTHHWIYTEQFHNNMIFCLIFTIRTVHNFPNQLDPAFHKEWMNSFLFGGVDKFEFQIICIQVIEIK